MSSSAIHEATTCLLAGGVVLLPTDTVFGLAASPRHPGAVERVFRLKHRPTERRLPVLVASTDELESLGVDITPPAAKLLASRFVPGPLSIALGFLEGKKATWLAARDEVAIRIPGDATLLAILQATGPLFVTSANAHGKETPDTVEGVLSQLNGTPDFVLAGAPGGQQPSTLVNCRVSPPSIEREGAVSKEQISEVLA